MKKSILAIAALLAVSGAYAQQTTNVTGDLTGKVDQQNIVGRVFAPAGVEGVIRVWAQDGTHIEAASQRLGSAIEFAVQYQRSHGCAVNPVLGRVVAFPTVGIIHQQPSLQLGMVLQWQAIEQRNDGWLI